MQFVKTYKSYKITFAFTAYAFIAYAFVANLIPGFQAESYCQSSNNQSGDKVLAKIANKEISVNEFIERSELTIRPENFKNKNTTLNNLITEKILAIEAEGNRSELLRNPVLTGRLNGIKEQLMRDRLYYEEAYNKVKMDSTEVKNAYRVSMREYELEFYTIRDKQVAHKIKSIIDSSSGNSEQVFKALENAVGEKPVHKTNYKDPDDEIIHEALYTKPLKKGAIIGPLHISNGDFMIMKVNDWVDFPIISGEDQMLRWKKVEDKLHHEKAGELWRQYQASVMKGKKIEFDKETFNTLSKYALDYYERNQKKDSLSIEQNEIPLTDPKVELNSPLFKIDNKQWTVADFKKELLLHPLIYRTKELTKKNFSEQFKLAVIDMIRDHFITGQAYKKHLDNSKDINHTIDMWKDSFLALDCEKSVMSEAIKQNLVNENAQAQLNNYWNTYLLTLQKKYENLIHIDKEEFKKIKLSHIDFFAVRPGVPYPVPVPAFPTFISSEELNYALKEK